MESLQIDDRVMVRAELVRVKQERQAHLVDGKRLELEAAQAIRKARDLGVSMEEAAKLVGTTRPTAYKMLERLEAHEQKAVRPDGPQTAEGGLIGQEPY